VLIGKNHTGQSKLVSVDISQQTDWDANNYTEQTCLPHYSIYSNCK